MAGLFNPSSPNRRARRCRQPAKDRLEETQEQIKPQSAFSGHGGFIMIAPRHYQEEEP